MTGTQLTIVMTASDTFSATVWYNHIPQYCITW